MFSDFEMALAGVSDYSKERQKQPDLKREREVDSIIPIEMDNLLQELSPEEMPIMSGPIHSVPKDSGRITLNHSILQAAITLLDSHEDEEIQLHSETIQELRRIRQCDDEFFIADPPIVLALSIKGKEGNVLLYERVPLSIALMARHLKCPESSVAQIRPYRGDIDDDIASMAQPFTCQEEIDNALAMVFRNNARQVRLARIYVAYRMMVIGPMSSQDAADELFVQEEASRMGAVIRNEKITFE